MFDSPSILRSFVYDLRIANDEVIEHAFRKTAE